MRPIPALRVAVLLAITASLAAQTTQPDPSSKPATRPTTEAAISAGLDWLKRHQSPDGGWYAHGFDSNCDARLGSRCTGAGDASFDAAVTGVALMAFLGAGYRWHENPHQATVLSGLKYLRSIQDAQGCFGVEKDNHRGSPRPARRSRSATRSR